MIQHGIFDDESRMRWWQRNPTRSRIPSMTRWSCWIDQLLLTTPSQPTPFLGFPL
jgi:hypothetical protein